MYRSTTDMCNRDKFFLLYIYNVYLVLLALVFRLVYRLFYQRTPQQLYMLTTCHFQCISTHNALSKLAGCQYTSRELAGCQTGD